jgi:hypothetical protein
MSNSVWTKTILGQGKMRGGLMIHQPQVFEALIMHERARVDRDGKEFSLIVFNFPTERIEDAEMRAVCTHIGSEIRTIDRIGSTNRTSA